MDPLTIALAIYGGYQGYSSAKRAHANTLGQIFGTALGAYGGYSLGNGIGGLMNAGADTALENTAANAGVTGGINALTDQTAQNIGTSGITANAAAPAYTQVANQVPVGGIQSFATQPAFQQLQTPTLMNAGLEQNIPQGVRTLSDTGELSYQPQWTPGPNGNLTVQPASYKGEIPTMDQVNENQRISDIADAQYQSDLAKTQAQLAKSPLDRGVTAADDYSYSNLDRIPPEAVSEKQLADLNAKKLQEEASSSWLGKGKEYASKAGDVLGKTFYDEKTGLKLGNIAGVGVPAFLYASGAFQRKPYERSMFTYNVNYPDLYRNRSFQVQDPKTGQVYNMPQQAYIPEEKAKASITNPNQQFGPYKRETLTLKEGGIASLGHFRDGGVTYLPSKVQNDETDESNYMRANGYVEDATGSGNKNEDTMLAQLADGEFVTRTDGILGAGILAGADPSDEKQMRKMGADFFYEQQKRFKRIFDLLDASRKATQH